MAVAKFLIMVIYNLLVSMVPDEINPHPDKWLTIPQLATKYGYSLEEHSVITEDGYILQLFQLSSNSTNSKQRPPVLVMHGLLLSSYIWVTGGPAQGLGYILADAGYDVWLGNFRGNKYSKNHIKLDRRDSAFWDFSFDEMGYYDLPAKINYITKITEYDKIYYIGYSQGTTSYFVMTSTRPEMKQKIILSTCLAPVAYDKDMQSIFFTSVAAYQNEFENLAKNFGIHELLPYSYRLAKIGDLLCRNNSPFQELCKFVVFSFCGFNEEELDTRLLPLSIAGIAGASIQSFFHYTQMIKSELFQKYDYTFSKNVERYGQRTPPVYDLRNVTVATALFYSENDALARVYDSDRISDNLPNAVLKYKVPDPKFTHLDFISGKNVVRKVYDHILELMSKY